MSCASPGLDDLGWCGSNLAPTTCKQRRFSGCEWITVTPQTAKVFFRMLQSEQNPQQFIPSRTAMKMKVYREGSDCVVAEYDAWQRDLNGRVGFYFDHSFLGGSAGYYVGDVFLGCDYCFSLRFRLAPCELIVDACSTVEQIEACGREVCALYPAIGEGTIGGVDCALAPATTPDCGAVPPYFDDSNPNDFEFDACQAGCRSIPVSNVCGPIINPIAGTWVGWY